MTIELTYTVLVEVPDNSFTADQAEDVYISRPKFLDDGDGVELECRLPGTNPARGKVIASDCDEARIVD